MTVSKVNDRPVATQPQSFLQRVHSLDLFTPRHLATGMLIFLWLGIAARCLRYALCFPLWEDECFLCVNFIDRSFAELLQPLDHHQVAPPLFLWLERGSVLLFGFSEWSLRLIPLLASLASLLLFRRVAARLLNGPALLLAFGLFSVAYPCIRYAAEAKQYATDLFAALVLLTIAVEWYATRRRAYLWLLAAIIGPVVTLSYPATFVAGGVSLAILFVLLSPASSADASTPARHESAATNRPQTIWRRLTQHETIRNLSAWFSFNLILLTSFLGVMVVIRRQSGAELDFMSEYWKSAFPPLGDPVRLLLWLAEIHTSDLVAWPVGGGRGASTLTTILCAIGLVQLFRTRNGFWSLLILAPLALNFIAASMERYPYGGHVKFSMYWGPAVCLLAGWGAAAWNRQFATHWPRAARSAATVTLLGIGLIACASMGRDILHPYKTRSDERARAFAQWFWFNAEAEGDVTIVNAYNGTPFSPRAQEDLTWTTMFLCNAAIYRSDTSFSIPSDQRPLRCLVYRDPRFSFSEPALNGWLSSMQKIHQLTSQERYPFTRLAKNERDLVTVDYLDIYTFSREANNPPPSTAAANQPAHR